jgi:hypothetical protein
MVPSLHQRLLDASDEEVLAVAAMVHLLTLPINKAAGLSTVQIQKGANSARSDDTKSLKSAVIDWIAPPDGTPLNPPIARNIKMGRGFDHPRTGFLLCPAELDWRDEE